MIWIFRLIKGLSIQASLQIHLLVRRFHALFIWTLQHVTERLIAYSKQNTPMEVDILRLPRDAFTAIYLMTNKLGLESKYRLSNRYEIHVTP